MGEHKTPLIKGLFVNSHIRRLRNEKGPDAIEELSKRYGKEVVFGNLEEVPVREEIAILEHVYDILHQYDPLPLPSASSRSFEAGRLHLHNFLATPFGKILATATPKTPEGLKKLFISAKYITPHVFKNTNFIAIDSKNDPQVLIIAMENNDYPLAHFQGFFFEWMTVWKLPHPSVTASETAPKQFEYVLRSDANPYG